MICKCLGELGEIESEVRQVLGSMVGIFLESLVGNGSWVIVEVVIMRGVSFSRIGLRLVNIGIF